MPFVHNILSNIDRLYMPKFGFSPNFYFLILIKLVFTEYFIVNISFIFLWNSYKCNDIDIILFIYNWNILYKYIIIFKLYIINIFLCESNLLCL